VELMKETNESVSIVELKKQDGGIFY